MEKIGHCQGYSSSANTERFAFHKINSTCNLDLHEMNVYGLEQEYHAMRGKEEKEEPSPFVAPISRILRFYLRALLKIDMFKMQIHNIGI